MDEAQEVREVQEEVEAMMARNRWVFRPSTILKRKVIVIYIYFFTICKAAAEEAAAAEAQEVREVQEEVEAMMARNRWVFRPSTILKRKVIVIYIYFFTICKAAAEEPIH